MFMELLKSGSTNTASSGAVTGAVSTGFLAATLCKEGQNTMTSLMQNAARSKSRDTHKSPSSRLFSLSLTRSPLFSAHAARAELFML